VRSRGWQARMSSLRAADPAGFVTMVYETEVFRSKKL